MNVFLVEISRMRSMSSNNVNLALDSYQCIGQSYVSLRIV